MAMVRLQGLGITYLEMYLESKEKPLSPLVWIGL